MPGNAEVIDGAMQQAPQSSRQVRQLSIASAYGTGMAINGPTANSRRDPATQPYGSIRPIAVPIEPAHA
jgi:hypothetical protein